MRWFLAQELSGSGPLYDPVVHRLAILSASKSGDKLVIGTRPVEHGQEWMCTPGDLLELRPDADRAQVRRLLSASAKEIAALMDPSSTYNPLLAAKKVMYAATALGLVPLDEESDE